MNEFAVELDHLFISPGHDFFGRHGMKRENYEIVDRDQLDLVAGSGIVGDRFFDYEEDYKGQLTFFDDEIYREVKEKFTLPDLEPGAFRRNVVLRGVSLPSLIGKRFRIGEVEFTGSEESKPCYWMNGVCAPGTEEFLRGNGGLRCRITKGGTLGKGPQILKIVA